MGNVWAGSLLSEIEGLETPDFSSRLAVPITDTVSACSKSAAFRHCLFRHAY
ncbi:hypothetical protein [Hoeflea sp. IMCC20628]|uniref:hypothetical protein n=1 Tax=Hoeflea sp. IMCC20628 TaxID=1620421 RepID=UPI0012E028CB|nr:hypothetical protein [Hoeflea sp. IMCC20628]